MNQEFKVKWVAALRSGKYIQAMGGLFDGVGHCCLGVACDTLNPEGWIRPRGGTYYFDGSWSGFSPRILSELHLDRRSESALINMNDDGKSFAEIADWIEANL